MVKEDLEELLLKAPYFHKCYNSQNAILRWLTYLQRLMHSEWPWLHVVCALM